MHKKFLIAENYFVTLQTGYAIRKSLKREIKINKQQTIENQH